MPPQIKQLLSASKMQSRDHPLNRSTRPLLERKHFAAPGQPKKKSSKELHGFNDFNSIPRHPYDTLGAARMNMYGEITTNDFKFSDELVAAHEDTDSMSSFETPRAVRKAAQEYAAWKPIPPPRVVVPIAATDHQDKGPFVFGVSQNSFLPAYGGCGATTNSVPVIAINSNNNKKVNHKYSEEVAVDGSSPNTSQVSCVINFLKLNYRAHSQF